MANPEHVAILRQGAGTWNQWRKANPEVVPDLSGADLSRAYLEGANLQFANLTRAKLTGAYLTGADLTGAYLTRTDLRGANLMDANLTRANLGGAFLFGANLQFANLTRANLEGANLINAHLNEANLTRANLEGANLINAHLNEANLTRANLNDANLKGANLTRAKLTGAKLRDDYHKQASLYIAGTSSMKAIPSLESIRVLISGDKVSGDKIGVRTVPDEFIYADAEMDEQVIVNRVTTVEVIVSKEELNRITSATSQSGKVEVDPEKCLIVQVVPKTNFITVDSDRIEVNPPEKGKPHHLYFDLRATHLGEGEVWVILRQNQVSLLTLALRPQIVENRAGMQKMVMAATQLISAPAAPQSTSQKINAFGIVDNLPSQPQRLHQLRIIERRNGNQITYLYELSSPSLSLLSLHESKPIHSDRFEYVENLYKEIESRWLSTQGDKENFAEELRAFGGQLFDQLFPEQLQRQLWKHREQIDSIMVISTEPFIPWELVHLKPPGQSYLPDEACFLGQMGLVRWLHGVGFPSDRMFVRNTHAHYVIPNYPHPQYKLPQAEQEAAFLEQHFGATKVDPQPNHVRQKLQQGDFDLLHFAGHGVADQGNITNAKLMMEGRIEKGKYIPADFSATTVEQYCRCNSRDRANRPMVVLNACQIGREGYGLTGIGGFAQAFLKGGTGVFVGPLWSVGDRPARIFTETLYSSLIAGMTLSKSTITAREAAKESGDSTWLAYAVYGHPHLKLRMASS